MRKKTYLIGLAALALIGAAHAQYAPVASVQAVSTNGTSAVWDAPSGVVGPLLEFQSYGLTNSGVTAVRHVTSYGYGGNAVIVTNTVEATAAANTRYAYPLHYVPPITSYYVTNDVILSAISTPVKPVLIGPGDKLLFALTGETNTLARFLVKVGTPAD
jgi:hypothetical protein